MPDAANSKLTKKLGPTSSGSIAYRYLGATALALVGIGVRIGVAAFHSPVHLIFYYAAITTSVWLFDIGPALLTLALCFVPAILDIGPFRGLGIYFVGDTLGLVVSITIN